MIRFFNVGKRYPGGQVALRDVSFHIPRGQFVFLTGASGAGKSTLLKLIFREDVPSSGQILVNGRNVSSIPSRKIPYLRRSIGVVFQDFRLLARKTVFENVTYLPRLLGHDRAEQRRLAVEALQQVGLAHRLSAFPLELSGGEQQRVAIARSLINDPELIIADEPTGNLDPDLSRDILRLFLEINRRGTTLLVATHDRDTIHRVGGRVLTLDGGELAHDTELAGSGMADFGETIQSGGPWDEPSWQEAEEGSAHRTEADIDEAEDNSAGDGAIEDEDGQTIDSLSEENGATQRYDELRDSSSAAPYQDTLSSPEDKENGDDEQEGSS